MSDYKPNNKCDCAFNCAQYAGRAKVPDHPGLVGKRLVFNREELHVPPEYTAAAMAAAMAASASSEGAAAAVAAPSPSSASGQPVEEEDGRLLNCLRNPETKKLVKGFEKNVIKLLASTTSQVVEGAAASQSAAVAAEIGADEQKVEKAEASNEKEFCEEFDAKLALKEEEKQEPEEGEEETPEERFEKAVANLGEDVEEYVDYDLNGIEFNPFRLVHAIGERLGYMSDLIEQMCYERGLQQIKEAEAVQMVNHAADLLAENVFMMEAAAAEEEQEELAATGDDSGEDD